MGSAVTATFVFTDLVDSTATAARLGPAAAETLRQAHFRLLRGALSATGGTEVKNLGDGLMIMYRSPSLALSGAVAMQQAIDHHNRIEPEKLAVRVGMSTGEATEEDRDYFGDPVVEAARLCALAEGGQILASDLVRLLAGRNATHTFVDAGARDLKGIPEPVVAVEVVWAPAAIAGALPLPGRLVGAASDALFGFFGRRDEMAELDAVRKVAHTSKRAQLVLIAAEAGMGKTSLAAQFARSAHADGAVVLFGHVDEGLGIGYQPWIEALTGLVRDGDPELVAGLRSAQRTALARVVPDISTDQVTVAGPDVERLLVFEATTELLAAAAGTAAVLVVLDDVHWADTSSLQLLRHVVSSPTATDLTIVCTYRDTDLRRGDALTTLLADLHREANVTRMVLTGLDNDELADLMATAAGHELDENGFDLAHALRRETAGNPFFTTALLRHLGETGGIVLGDDGRWALAGDLEDLGLPSSIRDVVGRRVERLGDEAMRVLCLAAVIGREFDISLLSGLTDVNEEGLLDLLDAAVAAALLVETDTADRYRFAHALIQHSLYDELSPARCQRAHHRVGELLEADPHDGDPAWIADAAHHWLSATRPADLDKAIGYVRRAGDAARAALAPDDAASWYEQALDLAHRQNPLNDRLCAELLADLGTTQCQAGHPDYRHSLREAARLAQEPQDTDVLVRAALGFSQWQGSQHGDEDAKAIIRAALDRIGPEPTPVRARLLAALSGAHVAGTEFEIRRQLATEAVDTARDAGDLQTFAEVIDTTHLALANPNDRDQHIEDVARAVETSDELGHPILQARLRYPLMWNRYQQADLPGVDAVLDEMDALVEAVGLPYPRWQYAQLVTGRLVLAGRHDEADAANDRTLDVGTKLGVPDALGVHAGLLFSIRWAQGRIDEIADFFLDVARESPEIASLRSVVPLLLCAIERTDEARDRLMEEAERGFDYPFDAMWLVSMANLADAAATTTEPSVGRILMDRLAPYARHVMTPAGVIVNGAAARPLARVATIVGEYGQAEDWFTIAHDIHARLETPFWTALGELDHADLCLARRAEGDHERAVAFVDSAAARAAEYGFAALTTRADELRASL